MSTNLKKKVTLSMVGTSGVDDKENPRTVDGLEIVERFETEEGPKYAIRTPYGKVKDTSLPKDYQPTEMNIRAVDPRSGADHLDGVHILLATMPPQFDPDGQTEWIVRRDTKQKVLNYPGFLQPLPKPMHRTPNYVVRKSPGMGLGLYATRDLEIGELIFAERPLLIAPRVFGYYGEIKIEKHHTQAQIIQMQLRASERIVEVAVGRMSLAGQAYRSLANSHKEDGSGPLMGVMRTNSYGISLADGPDGAEVTSLNGYAAVGNVASRINHSCVANVKFEFNIASFSLPFYAGRKIKKGEQLFYSYCGVPLDPAATRQKSLEPYGLVCKCSLCANATLQSDRDLQTLAVRRHLVCVEVARWLIKRVKTSPAGIAQARQMETAQEKGLESLYNESENAGLYGFQPVLVFLHELYLRAGKTAKAKALADDIVRYAALDLAMA